MSIFNEKNEIYNPFGAPASADNPTTTYKKHTDLQHALGYDNSVSPDTDPVDYVNSRETVILKYLAEHSEKSHTFRIKCDMPEDEYNKHAGLRKKLEIHHPHYIKFTRVPDITKCTFGSGKNQKSFEEVFGTLSSDENSEKKKAAEIAVQQAFEKMINSRTTSATFVYAIDGQKEPIVTRINLGYSLVIENVDRERTSIFPGWDPKKCRDEIHASELAEQADEKKTANDLNVKYEYEKFNTGINRLSWISPIYSQVPPDELLSKEELAHKDDPDFDLKYSQLSADKLANMSPEDKQKFDEDILARKLEMFQRLDHTGNFSDDLRVVAAKNKGATINRNFWHETERTITNETVRYPLVMQQEGKSFFTRLLGRIMSMMKYR